MADEEDDQDEDEQDAPGGLDDDEDEEGEEGESRGGGKKKLILILLAVTLVLLSLIGVGLFFTGILDPLLGIEEEVDPDAEHVAVKGTVFFKLEDFTLNLSSDGKKSRFFKVGLTLVLLDEIGLARVEALAPRIQDNVINYLRELKPKELAGSAGYFRLRQNILLRVRAAVAPTVITDVLFSTSLVQ
jgi:flagellar FliL protein